MLGGRCRCVPGETFRCECKGRVKGKVLLFGEGGVAGGTVWYVLVPYMGASRRRSPRGVILYLVRVVCSLDHARRVVFCVCASVYVFVSVHAAG